METALKWDLKLAMMATLQTMMAALLLVLSRLGGTAREVQFISKTHVWKYVEMGETSDSISVKVVIWLMVMDAIRTAGKK